MTRIAESMSPVKVILPESAPSNARDLNRTDGGSEIERLPALLKGVRIAGGGALSDDKGVAEAVKAGVTAIVGRPRLTILLAANRAGDMTDDRETVAVSATD